MHVDDRLSTVLRQRVASERAARTQFRQLLDLLDQGAGLNADDLAESGWERLSSLSADIPARDRATILREDGWRLRNPALILFLADQEPDVAASALSVADLPAAEWIALIPELPLRARGFLRLRRDLPEDVRNLLERLGIRDRALPAPPAEAVEKDQEERDGTEAALLLEDALDGAEPVEATLPETEPTTAPRVPDAGRNGEEGAAGEPAPRSSEDDPIGRLVRRIEAFQANRRAGSARTVAPDAEPAERNGGPYDAPPAPAQAPRSFLFETDASGTVVWAGADVAPMVIGTPLSEVLRAAADEGDAAMRLALHLPVGAVAVRLAGAEQIVGEWIVEAAPRFGKPGGRYLGHHGRFTRPEPEPQVVDPRAEHADRLRQLLHELRTPVNAIQGYAEFIQQELVGRAPHTYRSLAAAIAGDSARILSGFDELDRLARLESGTGTLPPGSAQLPEILAATVRQLRPILQQRRAGFDLTIRVPEAAVSLPVADAELLLWRVLAAAVTGVSEGETVELNLQAREGSLVLSYGLPQALRDARDLFASTFRMEDDPVSPSVFGTGFALRLARAEARAAGGQLRVEEGHMVLTLPVAHRGGGDSRQVA